MKLQSYLFLFVAFLFSCALGQTVTTDDCDTTYGCYQVSNDRSNFLVKWRSDGDYHDFVLSYQIDTSVESQYIAVGFSRDQKMNDDSVVFCKRYSNGDYAVETYYNAVRSTSQVDADQPSLGLSQSSASTSATHFTCSFRRQKRIVEFEGRYFDLNNPFYLLVAHGNVNANGVPARHAGDGRIDASDTTDPIDFNKIYTITAKAPSIVLMKLHGIFMIMTWIFMATNGIIIARYYKYLYPGKLICGVQFWFTVHRPLMITCVTSSIVSLLFILGQNDWQWTSTKGPTVNFVHSIFGILAISIAFGQLMAFFRPDKGSPKRKFFNWGHRGAGITAYLFSMVSIFLGVFIFFRASYWPILICWYAWIFFFVLSLEYIERRVRVYDDADLSKKQKEEKQDLERSKSIMLIVNLLVSGSLFIILLVLISIE